MMELKDREFDNTGAMQRLKKYTHNSHPSLTIHVNPLITWECVFEMLNIFRSKFNVTISLLLLFCRSLQCYGNGVNNTNIEQLSIINFVLFVFFSLDQFQCIK